MPYTRKKRENKPVRIIFPHQKQDPMDFIPSRELPNKVYLKTVENRYVSISVSKQVVKDLPDLLVEVATAPVVSGSGRSHP